MYDISFGIPTKQTKIIKNIQDIYNDIDIMTTNPPYPFVPEKINQFFEKNTIEVEIIEYIGEDENIIDYQVGKEGVVSFTDPNLNSAIASWNRYCYSKLEHNRLIESQQGKQQINFILFIVWAFFAILGSIPVILILLGLYFIWNYFIYPKVEENFVKKAQEDFDLMIEGCARNYSSYDIKINMSSSKYKIKEKKNKINDKIERTLHILNDVIRKLQNIEDKNILSFIYNNENINGNITFYNIITDIKINYEKRADNLENSQLEKDIIYYLNNFGKLIDLIYLYKDKSDEINKEINDILSNYYSIFIYFNNTILKNDEIIDISKLKVIGQDVKLYKDYIDISYPS